MCDIYTLLWEQIYNVRCLCFECSGDSVFLPWGAMQSRDWTRPLIQAMYLHAATPPPLQPLLKQTAFYNRYSLKDFTIHFY